MNTTDHFSESLETIFWVKILEFFDTYPDPGIFFFNRGSGMEKIWIRDRDKHPGSASLLRIKPSMSVLRALNTVPMYSGFDPRKGAILHRAGSDS
jgi:hypothetical protein